MRVTYLFIYVTGWASLRLCFCSSKDFDVCSSDNSTHLDKHVILTKHNSAKNAIQIFGVKITPRMTCFCQITAPKGYIAVLEVISYSKEEIERSKTKVFDGNATSDVLLWNSSEISPGHQFFLFSSMEHMRVNFETNNNSVSSGLPSYSAYVYVLPANSDCSKLQVSTFNASSSVIKLTSPYYPISYPLNVSCTWSIQAPPGNLVYLKFTKLSIEDKSLQVYDGEVSSENLLWEYDWDWLLLKPYSIFSYSQSVIIKFKGGTKPRSYVYKGFEMEYSAVEAGCSVSNPVVGVNTSFGSISTPGFPNDVPAQPIKCVWSFQAPVGHVMRLDLDTINLDPNLSICPELTIKYSSIYEYIRYDLLFQCKNYLSRTLISSGRKMQVVYTQPPFNVQRSVGVLAKYEAIPLVTTGSCDANQPGTIQLNGEAVTFHSLKYPKHHPGNMSCMWNITVPSDQVIELRVYTNLGSDCDKEYIRIYDGSSKTNTMITKLCQEKYIRNVYSSSNHLLVEFVGRTPSKGFIATAIARKAAPKPYSCSSRSFGFNQMEGMLASRGFPLPYPNNAICEWIITVPAPYVVNFTVLFLDLQPDPSCSKDYLLLLEKVAGFRDGKEMAKLCGKNINEVSYLSTSKTMIVKFRSDAIGRYPGFKAKFEAVHKSPDATSDNGKKVSTVAIVLIAVFSVLAVLGLIILVVWIVKYKHCCCTDKSPGGFDMVKMDDTNDVTI